MAIFRSIHGIAPTYGQDCFFAETAVIIGQVRMGKQCSVWYNAVVRGDVHFIEIGDRVNIQDNATIHCTYQKAPTRIGNDVSVGHNAIVHGCTIHDNVLIGMGAIVMDGAIIESNSIVAAGAVVLEGTHIAAGSIYAGVPAKKVKELSIETAKAMITRTAHNYIKYSSWFAEGSNSDDNETSL
ncbi:MAG: gamma carbonic anhydrase family protein [Sphingobacteriales bacterium]|nr:gamma carbonic anhydrase family protein [Sphingobacteriales bacterium]